MPVKYRKVLREVPNYEALDIKLVYPAERRGGPPFNEKLARPLGTVRDSSGPGQPGVPWIP